MSCLVLYLTVSAFIFNGLRLIRLPVQLGRLTGKQLSTSQLPSSNHNISSYYMRAKKESTPLKIDKITERGKIEAMEIISPLHFGFAMTALGITRKDKLAKIVGIGTSTLDAIYGTIERKVTLDKRYEAREKLDAALREKGWKFGSGGIVKIEDE